MERDGFGCGLVLVFAGVVALALLLRWLEVMG